MRCKTFFQIILVMLAKFLLLIQAAQQPNGVLYLELEQ